ncbi:MAG: hypothetical protein D4R72_07105 [Nitrosopumilales archaeon]|nr:MAG: hypothetical protein D4R72_07105 [Nitrosopumilales archaeon]
MRLSHLISTSFLSKIKTILFLISILAICGTVTELLGGIWDASTHALRAPEKFWTIQHVTIYAGVGMIVSSSVLGMIVLLLNSKNKILFKGIKILLLGSILQLVGGYADSISHEIYGVDGLVTPSHLTIETGLFLCALGSFMTLCQLDKRKTRKVMPIAIMTVLLSASWIGFNLILLFTSVVLCIPVYDLFSSGCAVL